MSATIEVTDFNGGNIENVNNLSMSGNANIDGNAVVGHNLKVEGWLEAPNVKATNKGVFLTEAALQAAYPHPMDGWIAGVVVSGSNNVELYVATGGSWTDSQTTLPFTLDAPAISDLQSGLADTTATAEHALSLAQAPMPFAGMVESSTPYLNSYCPVDMNEDEFYSTVYYNGGRFLIKYNDAYYTQWYNGDHKPAHILYSDGTAPHPHKLYVKEPEGVLYYMKQEEGGADFQPLSFDTTQIMQALAALDERVSDIEDTKTPFINAKELLNLSAPTSLSAVISAIDALSDKAKYEVRGAVVTFEAAYPIDSSISMLVWETWQWGSIGNWTETSAWNKLNNPQIAIGETYLIRDTNGFLRLSDDARRAITAVLGNAFSYEIIP
jgi:hypothetical protein